MQRAVQNQERNTQTSQPFPTHPVTVLDDLRDHSRQLDQERNTQTSQSSPASLDPEAGATDFWTLPYIPFAPSLVGPKVGIYHTDREKNFDKV